MRQVRPLFLLSLPRCGSTMAQRILTSHAKVTSAAEPWLLLPLLYSLREDGVYSEYHHRLTVKAIRDFCREMPGGQADYLDAMRRFVTDLYTRASTGKATAEFFLDKTPPYCLVADQLVTLFPDAPLIFLWRNPLAMVASIIESFHAGQWKIHMNKPFLFKGLERLVRAYEASHDRALSVRYENLVTDAPAQWQRITAYLGIDFDPVMLDSFTQVKFKGKMGDPTGRRQYDGVSTKPLEKWKATLASPVRKAWCRKYLRWIGRDRLAIMGHNLDDLLAELDAIPPWRSVIPRDLLCMARDVVMSLLEPDILRDKFHSPRDWRRVWNHF